MTQEEKAKAYDEAMKKIQPLYEQAKKDDNPIWSTYEHLFPELRESEDERIRRTLVEYFGPKVQLDFVRGVPIQKIRDWLEKQKEQNGEDEECTDFTIYHPLKNGKGKYECIPYSFYGSLTSFSEDKDLIDFLRTCFYTEEDCNEWIEQQKEQKPAWSKEDDKMLTGIIERGSSQVPFGAPALRDEQMEWLMNMLKFHRQQLKKL